MLELTIALFQLFHAASDIRPTVGSDVIVLPLNKTCQLRLSNQNNWLIVLPGQVLSYKLEYDPQLRRESSCRAFLSILLLAAPFRRVVLPAQ